MKTVRFDAVFEVEDCSEKEFLDSYKEFLDLWQADLKLYEYTELKSYEELLGL